MNNPNNSLRHTPALEAEIQRVGDEIQRLRVAYRRFFCGALEVPPDADRESIARALRDLRNINQKSPVDRFRVSNLEAQFNSYCEMFQRRLRDQEEGHRAVVRQAEAEAAPRPDVEKGVVFDSAPTADGVNALFQELTQRGSRLELDTFRSYLDKQVAGIRKKTGCSAVQFRLVNEGGKVRLKAKALGTAKT
ncbi:MAG: hypothetical protein K8J08_14780 [Thermoanaerobaculia bacterium]|nr:hypothetical protein [Thermoanaerobaculia bacterium]